MARRTINSFWLFSLLLSSSVCLAQNDARLKIIKDHENRIYKVFFASESSYDVSVKLIRDSNGEVLVDENVSGKGFLKSYALKEAVPGTYTWKISYGRYSYTEDIEILYKQEEKDKEKEKEPIKVEFDDLLNLNINVLPREQPPISIFLYNGLDEQIKYIFWEAGPDSFQKSINFSEFDAYDIKVEILQNGDVIFTETYSTY